MSDIFIIYFLKCNSNKKFYIGITSNLAKRKYSHFYELKNNKHENCHLQRAFNKYGEFKFQFGIIQKCRTRKRAMLREKYWIKYYDSYKNGFNQTTGGEGAPNCIISKETRKKLSIANKGNNSRKGQKISEEERIKRRLIFSGDGNSNAKLNSFEVKEIRRFIKTNKKSFYPLYTIFEYLSKMYEVTPRCIKAIHYKEIRK